MQFLRGFVFFLKKECFSSSPLPPPRGSFQKIENVEFNSTLIFVLLFQNLKNFPASPSPPLHFWFLSPPTFRNIYFPERFSKTPPPRGGGLFYDHRYHSGAISTYYITRGGDSTYHITRGRFLSQLGSPGGGGNIHLISGSPARSIVPTLLGLRAHTRTLVIGKTGAGRTRLGPFLCVWGKRKKQPHLARFVVGSC